MKRGVLLFSLLLAGCATSRPDLAADVDRILAKQPAQTIGVAYYDLASGATLLRNEQEIFHAASTRRCRQSGERRSVAFDGSGEE